jgi:GH25 family lysozyme M1 (1,4-beta-N-acetylmuramidase)
MANKVYKGIDVSRYQGSINFNKVKADGIDFVMIRCGTGYGQKACKDIKFETYYKQAKAAGLKVGTYFYSYAATARQASFEASWMHSWIKDKQFEFPVVFDMEERSVAKLGRAKVSEIANAFCKTAEDSGYYVAIYSSKSWIESYYTEDILKKYDMWVAQWSSKCTYAGAYGMWQYTSTGSADGVNGGVDMNYAYKDYPAIIKAAGLNGFIKPVTKPMTKPIVRPIPPITPKPKFPKTIKAGDKVVLKNAKLYANSTTSKASKKALSGTYYIYDGKLFGNRYRITNSPKRVNKKPAALFVTGYINKEDAV